MGRLKREMAQIHRRKLRKAREQVRMFSAGKLKASRLNRIARKILHKRLKAGFQLPAQTVKGSPQTPQQPSGGVA